MRKKKLYDRTQYRDQIWKIYDDDSEELIWENSWRDECWYGDNNPDSEYHKMMELEMETDFYQKWEDIGHVRLPSLRPPRYPQHATDHFP